MSFVLSGSQSGMLANGTCSEGKRTVEPEFGQITKIAVVGAHLSGQPRNVDVRRLGGRLVTQTRTIASYRLFALEGSNSLRPGMVRVTRGGANIAIEIWAMPTRHVGYLFNSVQAPLTLGTVSVEDGTEVSGFLCEGYVTDPARDITEFGGWLAYLEHLRSCES